jgi:hypothetical protein
MPDSIDLYVRVLAEALAASPIVRSSTILTDKRTLQSGLIRGDVYFPDGSRLHFRELLEAEATASRLMYSYHYLKADGTLIFRYDDTPHHSHLPGYPHHKHVGDESSVVSADPPGLESVLQEIQQGYPH